jgi:hypothetical protein
MLRKTATPKIPINTLSIQRELTTEVMRAVIKYEYKMSVDPNNNIEIGPKILSELRAPRTQTLRQTAGTDQRSTVQPATFREENIFPERRGSLCPLSLQRIQPRGYLGAFLPDSPASFVWKPSKIQSFGSHGVHRPETYL